MIDLTPLMQGVITIVFLAIAIFVIPLLKKKLKAEDFDTLAMWVEIGVYAAEQLFGSGAGVKKKEYVLNFLEEKGYSVNVSEIENLIEAEVKRLSEALK